MNKIWTLIFIIIIFQAKIMADSFEERQKFLNIKTKAEQGDAKAQYKLGDYYGLGGNKNYTEALKWYRKAAEQKYSKAQLVLGHYYWCGLGVSQNYGEAIKWYRKAAIQGEADAQYCLGRSYEFGHGVPKNAYMASTWYRKAAWKRNSDALVRLGCLYCSNKGDGKGLPHNNRQAFFFFERAASLKNKDAYYYLGVCYENGIGTLKNKEKAVESYKKGAEQGEPYAQYQLGLYYYKEKYYNEALKWFSKAAEQKHDDAKRKIKRCFYIVKSPYLDYTKAVTLFPGIGKDETECTNQYKKIISRKQSKNVEEIKYDFFINEDNTEVSLSFLNGQVAAMHFHKKSGELTDLTIFTILQANSEKEDWKQVRYAPDSLCWKRKNGMAVVLKKNLMIVYGKAWKIYSENKKQKNKKKHLDEIKQFRENKRAAWQGNPRAQYNLALSYANGQGVSKNYWEAVRWYKKAAIQGLAEAQLNLGYCYSNGLGISKNYKEAVKWYKKAAEQGDAVAQFNLGNCYSHQRGVPKDYSLAAKWYTKAAEQGNVGAQFNIGLYYYTATGVQKDYNEAVRWFTKAAEQGDADAQSYLGTCYQIGSGVKENPYEAVKWFSKAEKQGDSRAQVILGICYIEGKGVIKNHDKAIRLFKKAAKKGNKIAIKMLKRFTK